MDIPKPPEDPEQKNIIDKLANFVARNGPEFEQLTKQKQKDNPRFQFLFGGEFYRYYQFKVNTERGGGSIPQHGMVPHNMAGPMAVQGAPWQQPHQANMPGIHQGPPNSLQFQQPPQSQFHQQQQIQQQREQFLQQQKSLDQEEQQIQQQITQQVQQISQINDQIKQQTEVVATISGQTNDQVRQSEANLAAQYASLAQQQQMRIDGAINQAKEDELAKLAEDNDIPIAELDNILEPIISSCTKDAISSGKNWIFGKKQTIVFGDFIAKYFFKRVTAKEATFDTRLHIIYLINDILHHCLRKNADVLKDAIAKMVVPIFCASHAAAEESKKQKLEKLLNLWAKNKYFEATVIESLKDPTSALAAYQANEVQEYETVVQNVRDDVQTRYSALQAQHQEFVNHVSGNQHAQQGNLQQLQSNLLAQQGKLQEIQSTSQSVQAQMASVKTSLQSLTSQGHANIPSLMSIPTGPEMINPSLSGPSNGFSGPPTSNFQNHPSNFNQETQRKRRMDQGSSQQSSGGSGVLPLPDLSRPPPGFPPGFPGNSSSQLPPPVEVDLMPSVPYYDLPAGLMAPLVNLEDCDYKPLDPKMIRLPPPQPPTERLLAAVEAFYSLPMHDRPRDAEGWEKLGLYEFFKAKQKAKKMKDEMNERSYENNDLHNQSRSDDNGHKELNENRFKESPTKSHEINSHNERERRSRSRSKSLTRKRRYKEISPQRTPRRRSPVRESSRSPLPYKQSSRSRSRSRSPSKSSYSRTPSRSKSRSRSRSSSRSGRSRSRSSTPQKKITRGRSPSQSPPHFGAEPFYQQNLQSRLGTENKGHQLLKKMGWGGGGLGQDEKGIVEPIAAGEARDREDMYKGIGIDMKDMFEQFRKNKAQGFIERMRAREAAKKS